MGKLTCSVTKVRSYVRKNNCGCKNMHKCAKKMKCEKCDSNKTYCIFHKKSPANLEEVIIISGNEDYEVKEQPVIAGESPSNNQVVEAGVQSNRYLKYQTGISTFIKFFFQLKGT